MSLPAHANDPQAVGNQRVLEVSRAAFAKLIEGPNFIMLRTLLGLGSAAVEAVVALPKSTVKCHTHW